MEKENQDYHNLIARHFKGECSPFEENVLVEWIHESEANHSLYEEMKIVWMSASRINEPLPNVEKAWKQVRTNAGIESNNKSSAKVRSLFDSRQYLKLAATLLLLIVFGYFLKNMLMTKASPTVFATNDDKKEFYLPDSSKVWLNKNSKISFSLDYNESARTVELQGEAFFEVRKDKSKPFIVMGNRSKTMVLGTSFNVKTREKNVPDEIEVLTGKVSFSSKVPGSKQEVVLLPGDKATLLVNGEIEKSKSNDFNFLAWKSERLVFENKTMDQVITSMENYFGVPIIVENKELLSCRFTGNFDKPGIEEMMKVLSLTIDLSYSKKGNAYLIKGKGCN